MDYEVVVRAVYLAGRKVGSEHGAEELETAAQRERVVCSRPWRATAISTTNCRCCTRRGMPLGGLDSLDMNPPDPKSVLEEAGLEPYEGFEDDADDLKRTYDKGYHEGMEETVRRTARQLLGLEP
jgi:hypothetical protein